MASAVYAVKKYAAHMITVLIGVLRAIPRSGRAFLILFGADALNPAASWSQGIG